MELTAEDEEWMNAPMGPYTQGVYPETEMELPPRSSAGKVTQPLRFSEVEADLWASQMKDHQYMRLPEPRKLLDNPSEEMSKRTYKDELLRKKQEEHRRRALKLCRRALVILIPLFLMNYSAVGGLLVGWLLLYLLWGDR